MNNTAKPWLAGTLSLFIPGLGQAYLGQWLKAGLILGLGTLCCWGGGLCNLLFAYDAWAMAERRNHLGRALDSGESTPFVAKLGEILAVIADVLTSVLEGLA